MDESSPRMDFASLRQAGIRHLERLAGELWTDWNVHDPGITVLEQLCYVLSDLGYRIDHDVPDLLADGGADPYAHLHLPAEVLSTHPVTLDDLRRLVLDVHGVKNAWIEPVEQTLRYDPERQELRFDADPRASELVSLRGLYEVLVETSDLASVDGSRVRRDVLLRLHRNRNLCEDFVDVRVLKAQRVQVEAGIEIGPVDDTEELLVSILEKVAETLSPTLPFRSLDQRLGAGSSPAEVFDGPRVENGFVDAEALAASRRRRWVATSDLVHEILDVPGVRAVRYLKLSADSRAIEWFLELDGDRAPRLDLARSVFRLDRAGIPVTSGDVTAAYHQRRLARDARPVSASGPAPPPGRNRIVGRYSSFQHDFPALYGLGGLPASAPPKRRAQVRQLRAYLSFFDQILADGFAQLSHVRDLFAYDGEELRTSFSRGLEQTDLDLEDLLIEDPLGGGEAASETAGAELERKHRFLNHMLARFAEQLTDYSLAVSGSSGAAAQRRLARDKQAFLRRYPRISSARGAAMDQLRAWGGDNLSGLEERLGLKLGFDPDAGEQLVLVEHILLRPSEADDAQAAPLLAASPYQDPYSLQMSAVLPQRPKRFQQPGFRSFVERTLRDETPAHLVVYVHWLDQAAWRAFRAAHEKWLLERRRYWAETLGGDPEGPV